MKLSFLFSLSVLLFVTSCEEQSSTTPPQNEAPVVVDAPDLTWLEGKWERAEEQGGTVSYESWTSTEGGLRGLSFTLQDSDTLYKEQLLIGMDGDSLAYFADIRQDGNMVPFRLLSHEDQGAVFHNPALDFPWKIAYTRSQDSLLVRIAGFRNKQAAFRDLKMVKVVK